MEYKKLESSDLIGDNLKSVCRLIYQTDPYIYPALFTSEENAIKILEKIIPTNVDKMFCLNNLYVAMEDKKVIGLVLWKKGSMFWDKDIFQKCANSVGVKLPATFELVYKNYFSSYSDKALEGIVSLINVCICKEFRKKGIAKRLLESLFQDIDENIYELFCLEDNESAMRLYYSCGFEIVERQKAFTISDENVYSVKMLCNTRKKKE